MKGGGSKPWWLVVVLAIVGVIDKATERGWGDTLRLTVIIAVLIAGTVVARYR